MLTRLRTSGRRHSFPAEGVAARVDNDIANPDWVEIAAWLEQPTQHQSNCTLHRNSSKHINQNGFFTDIVPSLTYVKNNSLMRAQLKQLSAWALTWVR